MWNFFSLLLLLSLSSSLFAAPSLCDNSNSSVPDALTTSVGDPSNLLQTLDTCLLTVKGTIGNPALPAAVVGYGILFRFTNSYPSVDTLVIRNSGTAGIWYPLDNNQTYRIGFAVESPKYSRTVLEDIVRWQWPGSFLFQQPVPGNGNWQVLSVTC